MLPMRAAAVGGLACAIAVWFGTSAASVRIPHQTATPAEAAPNYPGYSLVWSDEFGRDGQPDPSKWTFERGFVRNQELQWYTPENARVTSGLLVIQARRERVANPSFVSGSTEWQRNREFADYTSSSLLTRGLHSWQYGRFEMRARIDTRDGLWPAFWTLGVEGEWPHCGEIDIMEYYRGMLLANAAWGGRQRWQPIWPTRANRSHRSVIRGGRRPFTSGAWTGTRERSSYP